MRPSLEACYFGEGEHGLRYERMAKVLEYTARKHCPDWDINVSRLIPPAYQSVMGNQSHVWNTQKLEHWRDRALAAPDEAKLLLIDGDMLVRRPLDDIWERDFDLAYTIRNGGSHLPLNGGVVFIRASEGTRALMQRWFEVNCRFLRNSGEHRNWRAKYAGINQASFGYLLEKGMGSLRVLKLNCSEWNLCEWERHDPEAARIIHVKSGLRRALFKIAPSGPGGAHVKRIIGWWNVEEEEMKTWQKRQAVKSASSDTAPTPSTSAVA